MKRIYAVLLALAMAFSLAACGSSLPAPSASTETTVQAQEQTAAETVEEAKVEPIVLKFSILENEEHGQGVLMQVFKEQVEKHSGGNIQVELYYNGSLYTQDGAIPALRSGDLDLTNVSIQLTAEYLPSIAMFGSTYMFKNYDHMRKVMDSEIGSELAEQVKEAAGYYPLGYYYNGSRELNLTVEKEIKTPEDMAGILLRMPNAESWIAAGESLGATVVPMAYNEVYQSLSNGTIQAQDNPMPAVKTAKFYEVTKQLSLTYHIIDFGLMSINAGVWDSMTAEQQGWVKEAAAAAVKACDETQIGLEAELISFFESEGLKIVYPDIDAFAEYAHAYYADKGLTADWDMDLYNKVQDMA